MRGRRTTQDEIAAIARRRLELLSAELAELRGAAGDAAFERGDPGDPGDPGAAAGVLPGAPEGAPVGAPVGAPAGTTVTGVVPGRHARRPVSLARRVGGAVHDRLPPTLQGRVRLGPNHLTVVALVVAAALALTSWWVVRAGGSTTVVPASSAGATAVPGTPALGSAAPGPPAAAGSAGPTALVTPVAEPGSPPGGEVSATAAGVVVVDVAGRVRHPGIASLPVGSRVVDALEAAGGARRGVDLTALNLARVLVDGEQIVVGVRPPGGVAAPAASSATAAGPGGAAGALVNINTATQAELEELPGVGPVTAGAILEWRAEHGPFTAVDELMEVSGIGEATLAEIAPFATL